MKCRIRMTNKRTGFSHLDSYVYPSKRKALDIVRLMNSTRWRITIEPETKTKKSKEACDP